MNTDADCPAWNDLEEGRDVRETFTIGDADMAAFAELSGDRNPLHTDAEFARARGFPDRVVYGGLILARVSRLLGMRMPGRDGLWAGIRMSFRQPLHPGEAAVLTGRVKHRSDAARLLTIALEVRCGDRLIASGSAESAWRGDV